MKILQLLEIEKLIDNNHIREAEKELSQQSPELLKNPKYLFLRARVFYLKKLYYLAIDTLFIALEFEQNDKIFVLLSKIYNELGNYDLSKKLLNSNLRLETANNMKDTFTGTFRKNN